MEKLKEKVPFDPGFSQISFSFVENIKITEQEFIKLKTFAQKRFWLVKYESMITEFINKHAAFYLGCILWGGFIRYQFKDKPKEISGNTTANLSKEELENLDCALEVKASLDYIKNFDRDCKYFLNRKAKISPFIIQILESYIEFAELNNNFIGVNKTNQIKLPWLMRHFETLKPEELDILYKKINSAIESKKIENLLEIGFYK